MSTEKLIKAFATRGLSYPFHLRHLLDLLAKPRAVRTVLRHAPRSGVTTAILAGLTSDMAYCGMNRVKTEALVKKHGSPARAVPVGSPSAGFSLAGAYVDEIGPGFNDWLPILLTRLRPDAPLVIMCNMAMPNLESEIAELVKDLDFSWDWA